MNEVRDGVLRVALRDFAFGMRDLQALEGVSTEQADYTGTGNFSVTDEKTSFSAETVIKAEGMSEARMPLHRAQGRIFGAASFGLTLAPRDAFGGRFSGSLRGTYANGVMSITGNAHYRASKLNGSVTVLIAPRGVAWTEVLKRLPQGAPPITVGAALAPGHVVVGWGSLDFRINEWLTGSASVVVDPDGYITSHGILRPTVEHQFLTDSERYEVNKVIVKPKRLTKTFATALVANLNGWVSIEVRAGGRIGPLRLYGLEVDGHFSTRPGTLFTGRITGRANLSAQASIGATIKGGLSASLGPTADVSVDVLSVEVGITGQATLRAYVELQPAFERLPGDKPDEATYKISGKLTAGGAVSLGLRGYVGFSIASFDPKIDLARFQYPLGGVSIETEFSHVLGSKKGIEISDPKLGDFNEAQFTGFMQDTVQGKGAEERQEACHQSPPDRYHSPTAGRAADAAQHQVHDERETAHALARAHSPSGAENGERW